MRRLVVATIIVATALGLLILYYRPTFEWAR
jgi:hypothetical protein